MKRSTSLAFAFIGVILISSIGIALSYRSLLWAFLMTLASVGFLGFAFAYKARRRRRMDEARPDKPFPDDVKKPQ